MQKTSAQFEDLIRTLPVIPDDFLEQKLVNRYYRLVNIFRVSAIVVIACFLVANLLRLRIRIPLLLFSVALFSLYVGYRSYFSKKWRDLLLEECDPDRAFTRYFYLISHARRPKGWGLHFYNLASLLLYAGKKEVAASLLPLMEKYSLDTRDLLYRRLIEAEIAFCEQDLDTMNELSSSIQQLVKQNKLDAKLQALCREQTLTAFLLQLWKQGEYDRVYYTMDSQPIRSVSMLAKVKQNYFLYKAASAMGDFEQAEVHRKFVQQNCGGLRYGAEL